MDIRGGCVKSKARMCRCAYRSGRPPAERHHNVLGFRPVAETKEIPAEERADKITCPKCRALDRRSTARKRK